MNNAFIDIKIDSTTKATSLINRWHENRYETEDPWFNNYAAEYIAKYLGKNPWDKPKDSGIREIKGRDEMTITQSSLANKIRERLKIVGLDSGIIRFNDFRGLSYEPSTIAYFELEGKLHLDELMNDGPICCSAYFTPKKIIRNNRTTVVIWDDDTKTIVRCEPNKKYDVYEAFTAALAKKIFGNNTKLKKVIKENFTEQKNRK